MNTTTQGAQRPPVALTFMGATGTVTGSKFLLDSADGRVLVDCGMFQGERQGRRANWQPLGVDPATVGTVVLTHAHLDHCGYLPRLVRDGFTGVVLCTPTTAQLVEIVLRDAAHLQEEEAAYAQRAGFSKHEPPLPLFDTADAERAIELLRPVPLGEEHRIGDHSTVTLRSAGHILGSSFAELNILGHRVTVSGDLGRTGHPLLLPPAAPSPADTVLIESTYGDRKHEAGGEEQLAAALRRTVDRGGVALLPAFAVDRTPMLLHIIAGLIASGQVPDVPVYVDSPMALEALSVYREAIKAGDPQFRPEITEHSLRVMPPKMKLMRSQGESASLNETREPCIIISASGMATGGRVLHHLKYQLPHSRNCVILTGFQVPGTRGRALQDGVPQIKIHGRYIPVRAEVVSVEGFSAHADAGELVAWLGQIPDPQTVYVVHGEPHASEVLVGRIHQQLQYNAVTPRPGERVRLA